MVTFDQLMQPLIIALNNLGGSGFRDSPGLFLPDTDNFLDRKPQQVTNVFTINAVDGASFEAFLRERNGAQIISESLGELL